MLRKRDQILENNYYIQRKRRYGPDDDIDSDHPRINICLL